jgi:hypothetical protein
MVYKDGKNTGPYKTSIIPVSPGIVSYETWPNIIPNLLLYGFELRDD